MVAITYCNDFAAHTTTVIVVATATAAATKLYSSTAPTSIDSPDGTD